jgi:ATP-dependent DNA ligase
MARAPRADPPELQLATLVAEPPEGIGLAGRAKFDGYRTDDGRLRHPSFQGLRRDKPPGDVIREAPAHVER